MVKHSQESVVSVPSGGFVSDELQLLCVMQTRPNGVWRRSSIHRTRMTAELVIFA